MEISIVRLGAANWPRYSEQIMRIEEESYEPARRDTEEFLRRVVEHPQSICVVALSPEEEVLGFCLGAPLEAFPTAGGAQDDPEWGKGTTLYTADLTVSPRYQRQGMACS